MLAEPAVADVAVTRLGAVHVTASAARLYVARPGAVEELVSSGFPVRADRRPTAADATEARWRPPALEVSYLERIRAAVRAALPADVPLVVGGDGGLVFRLSAGLGAERSVVGLAVGGRGLHRRVDGPDHGADVDALLHLARRLAAR